jgi:hypothetical protein
MTVAQVPKVLWPDGRKFAFTIFDDTDWATVEKVKPVYDLLADLGMRTTKSVWVFDGEGEAMNGGETCEDRSYLNWVMRLRERGFEIGLHNIAPTTSVRERTRRGLERFGELFGRQMIVHCNHLGCQENIYWGDARLTGWRRGVYRALTRGRNGNASRGHVPSDAHFWGDLCRERVGYVRNFVFDEPDTLALCPAMPYHDPRRPFVNYWFASSNGSSLRRFLNNFTYERLDRLIEAGSLSVAYVHFAAGFAEGGRVDAEFRRRLEYLAKAGGWFAPVSEVLDYLRDGQDTAERSISHKDLRRLETRWLASKVRGGTS